MSIYVWYNTCKIQLHAIVNMCKKKKKKLILKYIIYIYLISFQIYSPTAIWIHKNSDFNYNKSSALCFRRSLASSSICRNWMENHWSFNEHEWIILNCKVWGNGFHSVVLIINTCTVIKVTAILQARLCYMHVEYNWNEVGYCFIL